MSIACKTFFNYAKTNFLNSQNTYAKKKKIIFKKNTSLWVKSFVSVFEFDELQLNPEFKKLVSHCYFLENSRKS